MARVLYLVPSCLVTEVYARMNRYAATHDSSDAQRGLLYAARQRTGDDPDAPWLLILTWAKVEPPRVRFLKADTTLEDGVLSFNPTIEEYDLASYADHDEIMRWLLPYYYSAESDYDEPLPTGSNQA